MSMPLDSVPAPGHDPAPAPVRKLAQRPATLRPARREARDGSVRLVECAPFPRASSGPRWCTGITRDVSRSGLGVRLGTPLPEGSLVRVRVRCVEGRVTLDTLARVVWCRARGEGSAALGLSVLTDSSVGRRAHPRRRETAPIAVCA